MVVGLKIILGHNCCVAAENCNGYPEIVIGVLADFLGSQFTLFGVSTFDLDFKRNYDPSMISKYGPKIIKYAEDLDGNPTPEGGLHPCLKIRPVALQVPELFENREGEFTAWSAHTLASGKHGMPIVHGLLRLANRSFTRT